jgi:hypothetical protein
MNTRLRCLVDNCGEHDEGSLQREIEQKYGDSIDSLASPTVGNRYYTLPTYFISIRYKSTLSLDI